MAVFTIQAPDGRRIKIQANDQATALRGAQEWAAANPASAASPQQPQQQTAAPQQQAPAPTDNWQAPGVLAPIQYSLGPDGKPNNMRLALPRILTDTWDAMQAPGKALQGGYDQVEVSANGEVSPFDPRMVSDASTLAGVVSPISPASRLGSAFGAAAQAARKGTPAIADLYAARDAAYKAVDNFGANFSSDAIDGLYNDIYRRLGERNIDPNPDGVHKATINMLNRLDQRQGPMSLSRLDQLRQTIRRDVIDSGTKGDQEMGRQMIAAIDNFIENAGPGQISGVTGQTASFAIKTARTANATLRKSETIQEALDNARLRAASSGSGGNIDNTIRQELRKILTNPDKARGFTQAELKTIEGIVTNGGKLQDILRVVGKLSPSGNGLMAALGLGATAANPLLAAAPAAGLVAKAMTDRATQAGTERLTRLVRTGSEKPLPPVPSPITPKASTTLIEENFGPGMLPVITGKIRLGA